MPKWPFLFPGTKQNVGRKPGNQVGSLFFSDIELRRVIATASFMSFFVIHSSSVGRCLNAAAGWWGTKIGLTRVTPPKSNMSPKKELFQQGIHLSTIDFQVKFVSFQGITTQKSIVPNPAVQGISYPWKTHPRRRSGRSSWNRKGLTTCYNQLLVSDDILFDVWKLSSFSVWLASAIVSFFGWNHTPGWFEEEFVVDRHYFFSWVVQPPIRKVFVTPIDIIWTHISPQLWLCGKLVINQLTTCFYARKRGC